MTQKGGAGLALLEVQDLTFTYPGCDAPAIRDISFTVERGELLVLCGATGSGKTTLLRLLKHELAPNGTRTGRILLDGTPPESRGERASAAAVGYVMQRPEQQIVTDKVWHELAFGLENLHVPQDAIARRVAEMASYFGIGAWYERDTATLSGGQKQLLSLAAVMVMQPQLLILDEPTAQLDPIAAASLLHTVHRLNRELGLTVILCEHRLEEAVPLCDRLMVMEGGRIRTLAPPAAAVPALRDAPRILCGMPAAARLWTAVDGTGTAPLTVREGRQFVETHYGNTVRSLPETPEPPPRRPVLSLREACFRYERRLPDVLRGLDLDVCENEILCILGENGSGKSTLLRAAAGLLRLYSGSVTVFGKPLRRYPGRTLYQNCLAMLPQDVQTLFVHNTVRAELEDAGADPAALPFDVTPLLDRHPYDLSGGEQQLAALAKVLAAKPRLLLLDEPTKGLDAAAREDIAAVLRRLREDGVTIVAVTHDVEFAAVLADRCAMCFGGRIVSTGTPRAFFSENSFYTTAVSRMTRGYYDGAVTVDDAAALLRANAPEVPSC